MPEELFAFTEAQVARLKRLLDSVEVSDQPSLQNSKRRRMLASRVVVGLLTDAVAATTGLATKPKVGTLNVYSFSSTGIEDTTVDVSVYNFAPQAATTDRWVVAERDDYTGKFVITTQFCS